APLFAVFFLIMLAVPLVLEGLFEIPFKGDVIMMIAAGSLLVIGYLALGALLQLLVGDLATGLGLTGLIVSPAFGYAGVGFPILGMNAFAEIWGALLPLRWYMAVLLGQAARGLPLHDSARPFAALAARHRWSIRRRMAARARAPRRLHPPVHRAVDLWALLSAALPQPDSPQGPDRCGRQRPERTKPRDRPDLGRQR